MAAEDRFELADVFAEVASVLAAEHGEQATLDRMCHLLVRTVEACDHAGVSLVQNGRILSLAVSDEVAATVDRIQDEVQQGPCHDAISGHEIFLTGRLSEERRWDRFATRAHEVSGVESILAVRMVDDGDALGAVNLYSTRPNAFDDDDVHVATIFAAHAAVAVEGLRKEAEFREGLASRDVIGRAKGILQARSNVSDDEAFALLRLASQRMNVKLRQVAEHIADPTD